MTENCTLFWKTLQETWKNEKFYYRKLTFFLTGLQIPGQLQSSSWTHYAIKEKYQNIFKAYSHEEIKQAVKFQ